MVGEESLDAEEGEQAEQMQAAMALGWDYVAMTRRIAALEDQVAALLAERRVRHDQSAA